MAERLCNPKTVHRAMAELLDEAASSARRVQDKPTRDGLLADIDKLRRDWGLPRGDLPTPPPRPGRGQA